MGDAPLAGAVGEVFGLDVVAGPAVAFACVGGVHPVVDIPVESRGLVLEVAAAVAAFVDEDFLIGDAIAVGVAVGVEVEGVGLADEDAVVERLDHPREDELVDEDGAGLVGAVVVGVFEEDDTGGGIVLVFAVDVLHVGVHLGDVEVAVAVPGDSDGFRDEGFGGGDLEVVAGGEFEGF